MYEKAETACGGDYERPSVRLTVTRYHQLDGLSDCIKFNIAAIVRAAVYCRA